MRICLNKKIGKKNGYTLVEVMIASFVSMLVLGGAMAGMVNAMRAWRAAGIRAELHMDLEKSMERMRYDLRLSSVGIGLMAFYPSDAAEYTAISFPLSTPDANGLLPRDAAGNIIWDTTVIYHVRPGTPDEFIRSTFAPRKADATPAELYDQLVDVVDSASLAEVQSAAMAGESGSSEVIFQNLVDLTFRPPNMRFDGYAPAYERAATFNWGSVVLSNGTHELTFTVERKNASSSGYKFGIDRFSLSYSGSPREGEMYLPANTRPASPYFGYSLNSGSVVAQDMSSYGASWSGRSQLTFTPSTSAGGSSFTFLVQNGLWHDTNFDNPTGEYAFNCGRDIDYRFTNAAPYIPDIVIGVSTGVSWQAENVTDGIIFSSAVSNLVTVNVLHGVPSTNAPSSITLNGGYARFAFTAGSNYNLHVNNVQFGIRNGLTDTFVGGTEVDVDFGGSDYTLVSSGDTVWSDWIEYNIDRDQSYLLKWERRDSGGAIPPGQTDARVWTSSDGLGLSYLDGVLTNQVVALSAMEVRAPETAIYRSGVFDTRVDNPVYKELEWTSVEPFPDGDVDVRVRSSDYADMRDVDGIWYPSTYFQGNRNNDISAINGGRYVQYEVLFTVREDHDVLPILRDVTITWEAPTGIVDLVVDLARGPDYGIITADVNGQSFIKGVEVALEIFREGPYGMERVPGVTEVRPLNTGR